MDILMINEAKVAQSLTEDILYFTFPFLGSYILLLWFLFHIIFFYLLQSINMKKNKNHREAIFKHSNRTRRNSSTSCKQSLTNVSFVSKFLIKKEENNAQKVRSKGKEISIDCKSINSWILIFLSIYLVLSSSNCYLRERMMHKS